LTFRAGKRRIARSLVEEGERMFKVILWASDGSEHAERALNYARELARTHSARLVAVHVKEIAVGRAGGYPVQLDEETVERTIQAQVKDLHGAGIDAGYEQRSATAGGAAHALAEAVADLGADLIVVGTRGQGALTGLMLGSVTQRLLHVASCPVLAVPPQRA